MVNIPSVGMTQPLNLRRKSMAFCLKFIMHHGSRIVRLFLQLEEKAEVMRFVANIKSSWQPNKMGHK